MSTELAVDLELPIAHTAFGTVGGYMDSLTAVWRGVPYAAPVAGPNRFRRPRPPQPWDGVRDCVDNGQVAPQAQDDTVPMETGLTIGEDCLWLNIWAPAQRTQLRPVMVWLHGGAYCLGSAGQRIYDGRALSELGGAVVVTVNYRLGVLGFLDLSSVSAPGQVFESNLGLWDQLAALEWVRDNIAAFGGDPDNVTLFGESSGAGCVTTLLTVPRARGLFHRAIAQSPPATSVYGPPRAARVAQRFLELVDVPAAELAELPIDRLVAAASTLINEVPTTVPGTLAAAPVVDGDLVPTYPVTAFQQGLSHRVPLIIGTNRDEASLFRFLRSAIMPVTPDAVNAMLRELESDNPELGHERLAEIVAAYPELTSSKGAMAMSTDAAFRMPSSWVADAHSRHSPTWMYRFDYATPMLRAARIGAGHATELPYVFGNFGTINHDPTFWLGGRKPAQAVSGRIQRRWLAFAEHGVPAALDGSKHWAPYHSSDRATLLIDRTDTLAMDPDRQLREAWGEQVLSFT